MKLIGHFIKINEGLPCRSLDCRPFRPAKTRSWQALCSMGFRLALKEVCKFENEDMKHYTKDWLRKYLNESNFTHTNSINKAK